MARKAGENKSESIRQLLRKNPDISANDAIAELKKGGTDVGGNLFYFVKGKMLGKKGRRRKVRRQVASAMAANGAPSTSHSDVIATIKKVIGLATEVGGLKKLQALVEALIIQ